MRRTGTYCIIIPFDNDIFIRLISYYNIIRSDCRSRYTRGACTRSRVGNII